MSVLVLPWQEGYPSVLVFNDVFTWQFGLQ